MKMIRDLMSFGRSKICYLLITQFNTKIDVSQIISSKKSIPVSFEKKNITNSRCRTKNFLYEVPVNVLTNITELND